MQCICTGYWSVGCFSVMVSYYYRTIHIHTYVCTYIATLHKAAVYNEIALNRKMLLSQYE